MVIPDEARSPACDAGVHPIGSQMRHPRTPSSWPGVFGKSAGRRRVPVRVAASGLVAVVLLAACAGDQDPTDSPTVAADPCPDGTTLDLDDPYRTGPQALFSAAGGEVWVTARSFSHGGIFDPEVGLTTIYIGTEAEPLIHQQQSSRVDNAVVKTHVEEGTWSSVELPEGRYRLWSSTGGDVWVRSCQPDGVTDPQPVHR